MSGPGMFTVRSDSTGALVLTGELDGATIRQLQDKIDEKSWFLGNRSFSTWPNSPSSIPVPCIVSSGPSKRRGAPSSC